MNLYGKLKWIFGGLMLLAIVFVFIEYSVPQKFGRFCTIMVNIIHGIQKPTDYGMYEITEEELREINVSKIASEMPSFIEKERMKREAAKIHDALHVTMVGEEGAKHNKTRMRSVEPLHIDELPEKFKILKRYLHQPFKMGACQICHVMDQSNVGALINPKVQNICYECHKPRSLKAYNHLPVMEGRCMECHDPHHADTPKLLKAVDINSLCLSCHGKNALHNNKAKGKRISMQGRVKHPPAERNCVECHDPHSAVCSGLLKDEGAMNLCLDCHSNMKGHENMKARIENSMYQHGAIVDTQNKCLACHNPHSTDHKNLLRHKQVQMCLSCHNKSIKTDEDGGVLLNIGKHLAEHPNWHGPIKDVEKNGGCAACHNPHGSDNFSMLRHSFSKHFYDDEYTTDFLCFSCHEKVKVSKRMVMPDDKESTLFRDGGLNLHFLHTNNRKKRNCRACHDEHASKHSHLIRDYTEFAGIKYPLRYIETENGGSCAPACHKKLEYDRMVPKSEKGKKSIVGKQ